MNNAVAVAEKKNEVALPTYTGQHKKAIAGHLGACLLVQRTYGKQGEDLKTMSEIFVKVLNKYDPEKVLAALENWMSKSSEFPTPADIRQIIDPEPQFSASMFQEIVAKRKRGDCLTFTEEEYLKKYKQHMMKGI